MRTTRKVNELQLKEAREIGEPFVREYEENDYCELEGTCDRDRLNKLGQLEDILEKYNIDTNEELETLCKYAEDARNWMSIYKEKMLEIRRIENELGIDLITLFKASQQMYIFVKNAFGEINSREIYDIDIYTKNIVYYLEYQPERQLMQQHLNMYGKTFALTKEELINEK